MASKPWPVDWIPIVAANPEHFRSEHIRGEPLKENCRDCGCDLLADSFTRDYALSMPERLGRHIGYLCIPCHCQYDRRQITHLVDHRGGRN